MIKSINIPCESLWLPYRMILLLFFVCGTYSLPAQVKDSITVQLNKSSFEKGDSISIEISLHNYATVAKTATIQLWIENVKTGQRWKYRYPLVNGYINAKLKIDSSLQNGLYAFNFLLQKTFFNVIGDVRNAHKKDKQINYVMISKNKQMVMNVVALNSQQTFNVRNLLFQDSAFIIFSRLKQKKNDLLIDIQTPLDSAFVPATTNTQFITIGNTGNLPQPSTEKPAYEFKPDNTVFKIILPEIVIKSKSNKRLEDFEQENVTGTFTSEDAITLDGMSSDEMANAPDFYTYLTTKVAGLRIVMDSETGSRSFIWRNETVNMYLNEIRLDPDIPFWMNPSDIAMVKIFRPGASLTADGGAGGSIAIYTKTGDYQKATNRSYSFFILGYTGLESTWK